jgi:hypothetical protein
MGFSIGDVEEDLRASATRPHTLQQARRLVRGVQAAGRRQIRDMLRCSPEDRLRHELAIWQIPVFLKLRTIRGLEVLARLPQFVFSSGGGGGHPHLVQRLVCSSVLSASCRLHLWMPPRRGPCPPLHAMQPPAHICGKATPAPRPRAAPRKEPGMTGYG